MIEKGGRNSLVVQSTKWSAIGELISKLASPLINIVLARLLAPEIFGLVATFQLVTTFAEIFTDAGFQKYLIQHKFATQEEKIKATNVAFWTNLGLSATFWFIIFLARFQIARFVGSPGHEVEICVLSFQIPLHAFSSIQISLFRRDFRFKELTPIKIITSIIPIITTVPLAYFLRSAWAIIVGNLLKEIINVILLFIKSSWKPRFYFKFSILRDMLGDCSWLLADSIAIWLTAYSGTFIVSRALDEYYVGLYKTGIATITSYISILSTIVAPVLFSAFSRKQHQKDELQKEFFSSQKALLYILLPIGFASFIFRDLITQILLGSQWLAIADLMGLVGLSTAISIATAQHNSVYLRAIGKPFLAFAIQIIYVVIMIITLGIFVSRPFDELCFVRGILGFVYIVISSVIVWITEKISLIKVLINNIPSLLSTLITTMFAILFLQLCGNSVVQQMVCGFISICVYILMLIIIPSSRADLFAFVKRRKTI